LRAQVAKVASEGVTEAELNRVKVRWIAGEIYKLDSLMNQARELGSAWVMGLPVDADERLLERLRTVTADQVKAVAAKYFATTSYRGRAAPAAAGPEPQAAHAAVQLRH
jgi:zinc protease